MTEPIKKEDILNSVRESQVDALLRTEHGTGPLIAEVKDPQSGEVTYELREYDGQGSDIRNGLERE